MSHATRRHGSRPTSGRQTPEDILISNHISKTTAQEKIFFEKGFLVGGEIRPKSASNARPVSASATRRPISASRSSRMDSPVAFSDHSRASPSPIPRSTPSPDVTSRDAEGTKRAGYMDYFENRSADDGTSRIFLSGDRVRSLSQQELHSRKYGQPHKVVFGKTLPSDDEMPKTQLQQMFPSLRPADRKDVILLREAFHESLRSVKDQSLYQEQTKLVYMSCFNEIYRQVSITCQERGQLLYELWHGLVNIYEKVSENLKSASNTLMQAAQRDLDIPEYTGVSKEDMHIQNARLSEVNETLRAQLAQSNELLSAKDIEVNAAVQRIEAQLESRIQRLTADCATYQGYFKRLDDIVEEVREDFPDAGLGIQKTNEFHAFVVEMNLELVRLLVKKEKERIFQQEIAVEKAKEDQRKLMEKISELEGVIQDENLQRERLQRQLRKEREIIEEQAIKLSFYNRDLREATTQAPDEQPFELPSIWSSSLSSKFESDWKPMSCELAQEIVAASLAGLNEDQKSSSLQESTRVQIQLRNPGADFLAVDQVVYKLLLSVKANQWHNEEMRVFSRLSHLARPYRRRDILQFYQKVRDWICSHPRAIVNLTSQQLPCLTIQGQMEFIDDILPTYCLLRRSLFLYYCGALGISTNDTSWNVRRSTLHGLRGVFAPISYKLEENTKFHESVGIDRFISYFLDDVDSTPQEIERYAPLLFQAVNYSNEAHIGFVQFQSIVRFVNAKLSDIEIESIFRDGKHEITQIDQLTFLSLQKKYHFIQSIIPLPFQYKEEAEIRVIISNAWNALEPKIKIELETLKMQNEIGHIPDEEYGLLFSRTAAFQQILAKQGDITLYWLTFAMLFNDYMISHQHTLHSSESQLSSSIPK